MKVAKSATEKGGRVAKTNMFKSIVSGKGMVGSDAVNFIRARAPASILKEASSFLGVSEKRIFQMVVLPPTTAHRLIKNAKKLDAAITERVYRMGNTVKMALEIFESNEKATEWMRRPNQTLGGAAPLDLMDTEPGANSVRQVLNAIATGGVA